MTLPAFVRERRNRRRGLRSWCNRPLIGAIGPAMPDVETDRISHPPPRSKPKGLLPLPAGAGGQGVCPLLTSASAATEGRVSRSERPTG